MVLNLIPLAVLAAILLVVGYKLAKPALFASMYRLGPNQFLPFVVTIVGILITDLLRGVVLGVGVAVLGILRRNYLNSHFLHVQTKDEADGRHQVRLRLSEEVTFLNRGAILRELSEIPDNSHVIIDKSNTVAISHDVLEILEDFVNSAESRNILVESIESTNGSHRDHGPTVLQPS